jgi:acetate kinase
VRVLVVNAGSASLKLRLLDSDDSVRGSRDLEAPGGRFDPGVLERAVHELGEPDAVGHRIVHGGRRFRRAVLLDPTVLAALRELAALAPLHQPRALAAVDAVARVLPRAPAVGCFDTAFHAGLPDAAATYALPAEWRERWQLRRFGFHGLSHAYAARRVVALAGASEAARVVSCHLGAGASLAAVSGGRSVDTTMGFTPLEGLVMATRSGSVDPGLLLWLLERGGLSQHELSDALEHRSGVAGLAGSGDMREVVERAGSGSAEARLAVDVYVHRLRAGVAAMAAAMGGLDVLAFTGGVGENAASVRLAAAAGLGFLGVALDEPRNLGAHGDADIGHPDAPVRTFVIAAREDLEIARQVRDVGGVGT